jgi:predicted transcriptional regulator
MTKCDFCEKEAVGYCSQQCAIYCKDHQERAEKIEAKMYEAMEESQKWIERQENEREREE